MKSLRLMTSVLVQSALLAACGGDPDSTPDGSTSSSSMSEGTLGSESSDSAQSSGGSTGGSTSATTSPTSAGSASSAEATSEVTVGSGSSTDTSGGAEDTSDGSGTGGTPIDVSTYEPTTEVVSIPAPGNNASGVTWNPDTNRVWVVENGAGRFHEYAADDFSTPIRVVRLVGINGNDTEGLTYLGGGEVAVAFEGGYGVYIADVPDGDNDVAVGVKQMLTLAAPPPVGNNGLEGIAYDPDAEVFYAVGEGQDPAAPRRFFRFARPSVEEGDFTWQDPELTVDEPFIADRALPGSGASLDLSGIAFDARDGNVLIISHTGSRVIQLDPAGDGTILGELLLSPNQWEGVTLIAGDLVLIAESNEMQRFALPG